VPGDCSYWYSWKKETLRTAVAQPYGAAWFPVPATPLQQQGGRPGDGSEGKRAVAQNLVVLLTGAVQL